MEREIELNSLEKRQEIFLLVLIILVFVVVGIGIYFQTNDISRDFILVPLFGLLLVSYFVIYSWNAFTTGTLTKKWTPAYLYGLVRFAVRKINRQNNSFVLTNKVMGIIAILAIVGLVIWGVYFYRNFSF